MKFIKKFENHQGYEAYVATDYPKPNVSYCVTENEVHYNPILPPPPYSGFCMVTLNSGPVFDLGGSGQLTSAKTNSYKTMVVGAEIGTRCTSIGDGAFYSFTVLTSITMPNSVTSIGKSAFAFCYDLTNITIPDSVTSIGDLAFYSIGGLTNITVEAATPPTLGNNAFASTGISAIYVPAASVDAYKTANGWSVWANIIQPIQ